MHFMVTIQHTFAEELAGLGLIHEAIFEFCL